MKKHRKHPPGHVLKLRQAAGVVVFGALLVLIGIWGISKAQQTTNWLSTDATVVQAEEIVRQSAPGRAISRRHLFRYRYEVGGEVFENGRFSYWSPSPMRANGVARYETGQQITIHYNPNNPVESVVEPGLEGRLWHLIMGAGGVLIAMLSFQLWRQTGKYGAAFPENLP